MSMFSNHYFFVDYCKMELKDYDSNKCALVLDYYRPHNTYDRELYKKDFKRAKPVYKKQNIDI